MFDILGVNEAIFIAMQKQLKFPILDLTAVQRHVRAHTVVACLTGD